MSTDMLLRARPLAHVVALALCATACAVPLACLPAADAPAAEDPDTETDTDTELELDLDADVHADLDGACTAYCGAFITRCDGTLVGRDAGACLDACADWPADSVSCRHDWLAAGSCIAAGPESPTCGA